MKLLRSPLYHKLRPYLLRLVLCARAAAARGKEPFFDFGALLRYVRKGRYYVTKKNVDFTDKLSVARSEGHKLVRFGGVPGQTVVKKGETGHNIRTAQILAQNAGDNIEAEEINFLTGARRVLRDGKIKKRKFVYTTNRVITTPFRPSWENSAAGAGFPTA
jgi:hypothetical protein